MTDRQILVIGGGPAGLMAADAALQSGCRVVLAEAKPSLGRKLLMAGKSGLNLTNAIDQAQFAKQYFEGGDWLTPMLAGFGATEIRGWARRLGIETFTGSSGRVFPRPTKASPLLRAWIADLTERGLTYHTRWNWTGWDGAETLFATPDGTVRMRPDASILALGGASWPRLGSTGLWSDILDREGVPLAPFRPSNMGFERAWSPHMARHFGAAVKTVVLSVDGEARRGEFVISRYGVEGGAIYALSHKLREGHALSLDLLPDRDLEDVAARLSQNRGKASFSTHLRRVLRLSPVKIALLRECAAPIPANALGIAQAIKALPLGPLAPRPLDEAISTAGGVGLHGVTGDLMLKARPGVFCAGEMLDWDAPTGGYLLTAVMATGWRAGMSAAAYCQNTISDCT